MAVPRSGSKRQPADRPPPLRIFCDAYVLIAGSASTAGASHILLRLSELTLVDCVASRQAVDEAERNLLAKLPDALPAFRLILEAALRVTPSPSPSRIRELSGQAHVKDVAVLAAAVSSGADFLATFNTRHFRPRKSSPIVLSPGDVLSKIRRSLSRLLEESSNE